AVAGVIIDADSDGKHCPKSNHDLESEMCIPITAEAKLEEQEASALIWQHESAKDQLEIDMEKTKPEAVESTKAAPAEASSTVKRKLEELKAKPQSSEHARALNSAL
ncbi:unnamed protein product, partial [Durusdinium trenchii]